MDLRHRYTYLHAPLDWRFGIKWGVFGGLIWPLLVVAHMYGEIPMPEFPFKGRFEQAAVNRKRQLAHEERLKDLDMLP